MASVLFTPPILHPLQDLPLWSLLEAPSSILVIAFMKDLWFLSPRRQAAPASGKPSVARGVFLAGTTSGEVTLSPQTP